MRQFFKSIYAVGLGACLAMTACDSERFYPKPDFATGSNGYVAFEGSSAVISESAVNADAEGNGGSVDNSYQITVYRSSEKYDAAATVNINMNAVYTSTTDFANAGDDASSNVKVIGDIANLTIPAGKATATFTVVTTEDVFSAGDIQVVFEIVGASGSYVPGVAQAAIGTTFTLVIQDDDCPINLAEWAGAYEVVEFCGSEGAFNEGVCSSGAAGSEISLAADPSDPAGITAIVTGLATEPFQLKFNTCPMTTSFSGRYNFAIPTFNVGTAQFYPTTHPAPNFFDPNTFTIQFAVELTNQDNANYDAFNLILKKK